MDVTLSPGCRAATSARPAEVEDSEKELQDAYDLEVLNIWGLYADVLPARAEDKVPLFRRKGLVYCQPRHLIRDESVNGCTITIKTLQASQPSASGVATAAGPSAVMAAPAAAKDAADGGPSRSSAAISDGRPGLSNDTGLQWRYVAVVLCVETYSCPNRLVPYPGSARLLAIPPQPGQSATLQPQRTTGPTRHQQSQQQQQQVQQQSMGVSAAVAAEAEAVAIAAAGWRQAPCDRRTRPKGSIAAGAAGTAAAVGGSRLSSCGGGSGGGKGGGACSFSLNLSEEDREEASQLRLLIIYSEEVSELAARLCLPSWRKLESAVVAIAIGA